MNGILGKKLGMTQVLTENGEVVPVTVVKAGPCKIIQKKVKNIDGYEAVQIGFEEKKEKKVTKQLMGHFAKAKVSPMKHLREIKVDNIADVQIGDEISVDMFTDGDFVEVTGISKGKGFAGVVKRWGFSGGPKSHGSHFHRIPGAIGQGTDPSRVFKGRKLPGRMGGDRKTIQNLRVFKVIKDENLLLIKGALPGAKENILLIKKSSRKK